MEGEIIDLHKQDMEVYDVRISVSKELSEHYEKILKKRDEILADREAEDKTVIAILNATTTIIKELAKIQAEVYNSEKFAVLQQIIVNCLKEVSPELQQEVVRKFEESCSKL